MLSIQFSLMKCGEWDFRIPIIRHSGEGISFFFSILYTHHELKLKDLIFARSFIYEGPLSSS